MNAEQVPSMASLLKHGCQVTHYRHSRGWIETPDGRYLQPEANKVHFIKGMSKPFVCAEKINKGLFSRLLSLFRVLT
ncbi:phage filamentation protein Fil family protein [Erwinia pyrifoliae]|uniref:phage filamentation protein Fil family protein n=1 Tax=Erwinia pyrifoliae TaxID=79967 RepID=UPI00220F5050|nr:phage filamentation protein Fil family protein [Erwinia pyrifoliae]UWS30649.1 DUF2724 domain-containing protein [Erwinia pyrifoliae]